MKIWTLILLLGVLVSCSGEAEEENDGSYKTEVPSVEVLKAGIVELEDSLMQMSSHIGETKRQHPNLARQALIEKLLLVYRAYPDDAEAASCLDKVHMSYSALQRHDLASLYADTLLHKYPAYEGRAQVIESLASNYDVFIQPRDVSKAKYYYEMLLREFPNLPAQKKADVEFRLKHIDKTMEELIEMQINQ